MDDFRDGLSPLLAALVAAADEDGHLTHAAWRLGIPQSSMSRRLRSLERRVGAPLVVTRGRAVALTPLALDLAKRVRAPLADLATGVREATADTDPDHGLVRFGFPLSMGSGRLPDSLVRFSREYPGIRLNLKQAHGAALMADLRRGDLDLAITIPEPADLPFINLGHQTIVAVVSRRHRLAGQANIRLAELRNEDFVATPPDFNLRQLTEARCGAVGFTPRVSVEVNDFATMLEFVARGLGVALIPQPVVDTRAVSSLGLGADAFARAIALVWPSRLESTVTQRLSAHIRAGVDGGPRVQ